MKNLHYQLNMRVSIVGILSVPDLDSTCQCRYFSVPGQSEKKNVQSLMLSGCGV